MRDILRQVTEIATATLRVGRVSIWRFLDERRAIRCDYLYQPASQSVFEGTVLHAQDFPNYFRALELRRAVSVAAIESDPFMREFHASYFQPLGITSMLDAPIYQAGETVGIVCHEHIGPVRQWTALECEFAATVADTIGRLYEELARIQAVQSLGTYQAHVMDVQKLGALGRMAAGMAHDFKNVLAAIYGYADLIAEQAQNQPAVIDLVHGLTDAAGRGAHLTEQLLMLGQGTPGHPRVIDPRTLLQQYQEMLSMAAGAASSVLVQAPEAVSRIFVDPDQLERAILNLVMNARDAMPAGGTIEITLRDEDNPEPDARGSAYVMVSVRDTGLGMDSATRERIYEPFFTTKGEAGTGLGMAIVQHIVTRAGGFMDVESALGQGTTVRLFLPRIAAPAA
ncbi:MAG: sensor histidine kinase [Chloroflexota bacterium]